MLVLLFFENHVDYEMYIYAKVFSFVIIIIIIFDNDYSQNPILEEITGTILGAIEHTCF